MAVLGWLWLGSPFAVIALISHDRRLLKLVGANLRRCHVAGWTGVVMMCLGAMLIPGVLGTIMFWVGTPFAGLVVWFRGDDGDNGGDDGPDVPPVDWDEFEQSFWAHVRRRRRAPRRPRAPSAS